MDTLPVLYPIHIQMLLNRKVRGFTNIIKREIIVTCKKKDPIVEVHYLSKVVEV